MTAAPTVAGTGDRAGAGAASARGPVRPDRSSRRRSRGTVVVYAILLGFVVLYLYPFLVQVVTSFKTDTEAVASPLSLVPQTWTTAAYERLFLRSDFPLWFTNSVVVTVCVTLGRVFIDSLAGYALARLHFRGRGVVFALLVAVMAVPGVVLLIPKFLVLNQLGIYDSYAGLIIPLLADAAGIFIMKNFFESIPRSVEEAARIDGAGTFRTYWSIVLPMATPALVTLVILSFQGSWNELSHFIVAAQSPELATLTKGVAGLAAGGLGQGSQFPLKLGAAALMTVPVAILFFVFQRRIMNTVTGAVKE
ncbi:carbohydrate ABC transporter permease [uncultured Cellulomonas sp.]|uniref:carbohydrate ABC transporter permease n=1 Tax=uncultured Cellulomonas sp. TaxID=189682 RepID=UPI00260C8AE7|nr:carbohydrate ABC transporter permease [uncultured Cellulomonas sp.]